MRSIRSLTVLITLAVSAVAGLLLPASPASAAVCPAAVAIPFSDVASGDPFCREILNGHSEGWVDGYADGTFRPLNNITRQAAAAMMSDAYEGPVAACVVAPFTDVPVDHPFCPEISRMASLGVFDGYPDGTFRPSLPITRQAVATSMLMLYPIMLMPPCAVPPFSDVPTDHPFCAQIKLAANVGIIDGYADGTFRPANDVTRQAFVAILGRAESNWVN